MKLAIIDQSFHWPPTGGSWVDLRETCLHLQNFGIEPRIFVPELKRWNIDGGNIRVDPGISVESVPIKPSQFNFFLLPRILSERVSRWNPDRIMITNTFFMAPYFVHRFPDKPIFIRIYAHELMCLNYMNVAKCDVFHWAEQNPRGDICGKSVLKNPVECWLCGLRRFGGTLIGPRLNPVAVEYWSCLGFSPIYPFTVKKSLNKTAGIIVYNPFIKSMLSNIQIPVHIVPGAVDVEKFGPLENSEKISDKKPAVVKILMSGRLDDQRKGFSVFESAIRQLINRKIHLKAYITDSREDFSHPFIKNMGWIATDNLPDLYRSMDIVVCPSIWPEPFGLIVLEAMASGLPVVASRIGGMQYTVVDGETGFLFSPGNSEELASRLLCLINDEKLRLQMGESGQERVSSHFTWDRVVKDFTAPILSGSCNQELDWTSCYK
ncbi:glycosyltransferase family 4 protein [bacterium]|nr:glycosyltransferase family 4 protein [bacterium]